MIIRLIDIVLIILFGFITISDIDIKGAISLPAKKAEKSKPVERKEKIFIEIEIDVNENFRIGQRGQEKIRKKGIVSLEDHVIKLRTRFQKLENKDIAVIIKPNAESPIQSTVDVLDLCSRNRIPKNIARKSLALF